MVESRKDRQREVGRGALAADGYDCGQIRAQPSERDRCVRRDTFASLILLYLLQFPSILFLVPHPTAFLLLFLLLSFCPSSATLPPPLACTSSGHGSLSQPQRGCVGTGYLSYCPAPNTLLKHKYAQTHARLQTHVHTQMLHSLPFSLFISLSLFEDTPSERLLTCWPTYSLNDKIIVLKFIICLTLNGACAVLHANTSTYTVRAAFSLCINLQIFSQLLD